MVSFCCLLYKLKALDLKVAYALKFKLCVIIDTICMTYLKHREIELLGKILDGLTYSLENKDVRMKCAQHLLELLDADFFASYTWSMDDSLFVNGLGINMPDAHLKEYEEHYQNEDPITLQLQKFRRAVSVNEVMPQQDLVKTSFYSDFLNRDGLYWGVNLYSYCDNINIGDLRIWRTQGKENFTQRELDILDMISFVFTNSLRHALQPTPSSIFTVEYLMDKFKLTTREAEITKAIFEGKMDERIAADLNISFYTVRTHVKNIFRKLAVCNRASLVNLILSQPK